MPEFKAVNQMSFLFPNENGLVHKIIKLEEKPENFENLTWFCERSDKLFPCPNMTVQDVVFMLIEHNGLKEYFEISCLRR